ncbi:MAG: YpdA family putative bacillithiol disulfide reductase [Bacteroidota bacterium]|nr:YpdA family putative bacillithiol disulfide reductase [Rhodothermia bacterium]MCS7155608.1 YpdA family putative bacillithiol disulfide reductase [Bacteroidota bacterium]MDW8137252.1 YpdA family putative bacillithiol disulfide reductase [Bacteroidota bacterium]MDW8284878.1 YpdA family putative bacillithiol disulfide reductase [Bacteroidota bacterium]
MYDVVIVGGGPIGINCAFEARKRDLSYLVLEKGPIVASIWRYPLHMRFFSTPELLELQGIPMTIAGDKPTRTEALAYYRRLVLDYGLNYHTYEPVLAVEGQDGRFRVHTHKATYQTAKVVLAVGAFARPRLLRVPGETLPHVQHFYTEAHPYAGCDVLVVGGKNSAVEAALDLYRHGARVTMAVRSPDFRESVKYWLLPDIRNRIAQGQIRAFFDTSVEAIEPERVWLRTPEGRKAVRADFVLALTGHEPDYAFLEQAGVAIQDDPYRTPVYDPETLETNRKGIYLAGVVLGGLRTNQWFIENSRGHAVQVMEHIRRLL